MIYHFFSKRNLLGSKIKPEGKQMDRSCPSCGRSHQVLYIYKGSRICELCWNSRGIKIKHSGRYPWGSGTETEAPNINEILGTKSATIIIKKGKDS